MTEPLEPAQRTVPEPTDEQGNQRGWRAADVNPRELSDDEYAAQFTRHDPEG